MAFLGPFAPGTDELFVYNLPDKENESKKVLERFLNPPGFISLFSNEIAI